MDNNQIELKKNTDLNTTQANVSNKEWFSRISNTMQPELAENNLQVTYTDKTLSSPRLHRTVFDTRNSSLSSCKPFAFRELGLEMSNR